MATAEALDTEKPKSLEEQASKIANTPVDVSFLMATPSDIASKLEHLVNEVRTGILLDQNVVRELAAIEYILRGGEETLRNYEQVLLGLLMPDQEEFHTSPCGIDGVGRVYVANPETIYEIILATRAKHPESLLLKDHRKRDLSYEQALKLLQGKPVVGYCLSKDGNVTYLMPDLFAARIIVHDDDIKAQVEALIESCPDLQIVGKPEDVFKPMTGYTARHYHVLVESPDKNDVESEPRLMELQVLTKAVAERAALDDYHNHDKYDLSVLGGYDVTVDDLTTLQQAKNYAVDLAAENSGRTTSTGRAYEEVIALYACTTWDETETRDLGDIAEVLHEVPELVGLRQKITELNLQDITAQKTDKRRYASQNLSPSSSSQLHPLTKQPTYLTPTVLFFDI